MFRFTLSLIVVAAGFAFAAQQADAQFSIGIGKGGIQIGQPSYCPPKYCPPVYCPPKHCPPVYCPPPVYYPPQPPVYCPPPQVISPPYYPEPGYPQPGYPQPYPQPAYKTFGTQGQPPQFAPAGGNQVVRQTTGFRDPSSLFGR
jgi:hypothetical protein